MTALLDTWPERITASSLTATRMSSPGNSCCSVCCSVVTPGSTTTSYCSRRPAPHTIRLTVPGALAVDQHLARLDDDGVGDLRVGDGDARDVEVRRQHHRAAGGEHQHAIAIEAAGSLAGAGGCAGTVAAAPGAGLAGASERPAPGSARPAGATSTARTHTSLLGILLARRHVARLLFFFVLHRLGRPLGAANRLDRVRRRRRRGGGTTGAAATARPRRRARRRRRAAASDCPSGRRRGCRRSRWARCRADCAGSA